MLCSQHNLFCIDILTFVFLIVEVHFINFLLLQKSSVLFLDSLNILVMINIKYVPSLSLILLSMYLSYYLDIWFVIPLLIISGSYFDWHLNTVDKTVEVILSFWLTFFQRLFLAQVVTYAWDLCCLRLPSSTQDQDNLKLLFMYQGLFKNTSFLF